MTDTPKRRAARTVTYALKRAGIVAGYKYTHGGYVTHDSDPFPGPGVQVSRHRGAGVGNQMDRTDVGAVQVFLIQDRYGAKPPTPDFIERVTVALTEAGLPFTRNEDGTVFVVPDEPFNRIEGGQS